MELEKTMRAAFALRAPAPDFEDMVMQRLAAGAWRASQPGPRKRRQLLLIGVVLVVSAAAAVLVVRQPGSTVAAPVAESPAEVQALVLRAEVPAPAVVQVAGSTQPAAPPSAPVAADASQLCKAAEEAPPGPVAFTVLVQPLQVVAEDPAVQSQLRDLHEAVVANLRKVPGLGLADAGAAASAPGARLADYRVGIIALQGGDRPNGTKRVGQWFMLRLDQWKGPDFQLYAATEIPSLTAASCGIDGRSCGSITGSRMSANLFNWLPHEATDAQKACEQASQDRLRQQFEEQRRIDPAPVMASTLDMLMRIASQGSPQARINAWRALQRRVRPDLIPGLIDALSRPSTDEAVREELVTLLAVKFPDDSVVRAALAGMASSGADSLMRHVAQRVVSGEVPWREHVLARLGDTSLSTAQRLEPLYWMAEAMQIDPGRMGVEVGGVLSALQAGNGIPALAALLAGTQRNLGEGAPVNLLQQGQMTTRIVASVNHPAVPDLLIAYFDSVPNFLTLSALATRRDEPRVASKLEAIASGHPDPQLQRSAASHLNQPPAPTPAGN